MTAYGQTIWLQNGILSDPLKFLLKIKFCSRWEPALKMLPTPSTECSLVTLFQEKLISSKLRLTTFLSKQKLF